MTRYGHDRHNIIEKRHQKVFMLSNWPHFLSVTSLGLAGRLKDTSAYSVMYPSKEVTT